MNTPKHSLRLDDDGVLLIHDNDKRETHDYLHVRKRERIHGDEGRKGVRLMIESEEEHGHFHVDLMNVKGRLYATVEKCPCAK